MIPVVLPQLPCVPGSDVCPYVSWNVWNSLLDHSSTPQSYLRSQLKFSLAYDCSFFLGPRMGAHGMGWLWWLFFGVVKVLCHPPGNLVGSSQAEWCASVGPPMVAGDPACVPSAAPPQKQTVSVVSRCRPYLLCFFVFLWKNSKLAIPTQTRCLGVKELNVIWIALFSVTLKSWHAPWAS